MHFSCKVRKLLVCLRKCYMSYYVMMTQTFFLPFKHWNYTDHWSALKEPSHCLGREEPTRSLILVLYNLKKAKFQNTLFLRCLLHIGSRKEKSHGLCPHKTDQDSHVYTAADMQNASCYLLWIDTP